MRMIQTYLHDINVWQEDGKINLQRSYYFHAESASTSLTSLFPAGHWISHQEACSLLQNLKWSSSLQPFILCLSFQTRTSSTVNRFHAKYILQKVNFEYLFSLFWSIYEEEDTLRRCIFSNCKRSIFKKWICCARVMVTEVDLGECDWSGSTGHRAWGGTIVI